MEGNRRLQRGSEAARGGRVIDIMAIKIPFQEQAQCSKWAPVYARPYPGSPLLFYGGEGCTAQWRSATMVHKKTGITEDGRISSAGMKLDGIAVKMKK